MTKSIPNPTPQADKTITLNTPIQRGESEITEVSLRKPKAGELRGLKLFDIISFDVNAVLELLPRISSPVFTPQEMSDLDVADLTALSGAVAEFFAGND